MSLFLAVLLFLVLATAWVTLPFLPGLIEVHRKTDARRLKIVRDSEVDIRHFANGFRDFLARHLGDQMEKCCSDNNTRIGKLSDGTPYLILPANGGWQHYLATERDASRRRMILACGDLELPADSEFPLEIYARGSLRTGPGGTYRAILADGDIHLAAGNTSIRWLHAEGSVDAAQGCHLYARVSAAKAIRLADGCRFERLQAPTIAFGMTLEIEAPAVARCDIDPHALTAFVEDAGGRCYYRGDVTIVAGGVVDAKLVVTGGLTVKAGATLKQSVKSHADLRLDEGVVSENAVVSGRDLYLGEGCHIHGPVIAERDVYIAGGCRIGDREHLTTVTAQGIRIAAGVVVHGTVWGHSV